MEETTIRSVSNRIVESFNMLRDLTPEINVPSNKPGLSEVDDQFGRFNIFARNIGVFAHGHASLDHRLHNSKDAQETAKRLLSSLQWFLDRAINAADKSGTLSQSTTDDRSSDVISASPRSETSYDTSIASTTDTSEMIEIAKAVEPLRGVEETIDRLLRMTWLIRTSSIATQSQKANAFRMKDDAGNDYEAVFEGYAARRIEHMFPDASSALRQKLAKSVMLRRKRFLYKSHHQAKLNWNSGGTKSVLGTSRSSWSASAIEEPAGVNDVPARRVPKRPNLGAHGTAPSATSASAYSNIQYRSLEAVYDTRSVTSTAFRILDDRVDDFQPPQRPLVTKGSKEFECPYCFIMLPIREAQPVRWKQHFLRDLDPYVCLFPGCRDEGLFFADYKNWLQHMQMGHTRQWCCNAGAHSQQFFPTEDEFADHMRNRHAGAFAENHLPMLKRRAEVPGVAFEECPLCHFSPDANEPDAGERVRELMSHIASDLRMLAMISVPFEDGDEDDDVESQGTASGKANESNTPAKASSFADLPPPTFDTDSDSLPNQAEALHIDDVFVDAENGPEGDLNEWDFIEPMQYQGHDRDPTLQTFLRKSYLESSPSITDTKGPILPCWTVPFARNPNFFGREDVLEKAAQALLPSQASSTPFVAERLTNMSNTRSFVIYASGGMGKTQVAAEFVHRYRNQFDAVLWAHGTDAYKLGQDFNIMAVKLGLVPEDSVNAKDQVYTKELVRHWLVDPLKDVKNPDSAKASWLLVYDAVDQSGVLDDFWPYDGPGSILITSRYPFSWTISLPLSPFSVEEASEYLLRYTRRQHDEQSRAEVHDVSQKLGGHPLALTQMAGIMTREKMTFSEFALAYDERESRQQMLQTAPPPSSLTSWNEHSVASVWALESLKWGSTLLDTISMFDSDGIVERLYTETFGLVELPGLPDTPTSYQQARAELLRSSIIISQKATGRLYIHRLVQDVARMRLGPGKLRETFMACVRLVSALWKFETFTWRHGIARWSACEELFPHVQRLRELASQYQLFPSENDFEGDFAFARLLTDAGFYRHERGKSFESRWFNNVAEYIYQAWVDRITTAREPIPDAQSKLRELHASLAEIIHNRACIVTETNQPKLAFMYSKDFNAKMIQEYEASPGSELTRKDMRLAISWNELGNAYMLNREWKRGEECYLRSIETMRLLDNFQVIMLSLPLVNLGLAYLLQNRLAEAKQVMIKGFKDRRATYGEDDHNSFATGRYLHALGNVMASLGDEEQSLSYHRRALYNYKHTLGTGHHRTADLFVKVAEHSMRMEQDENALALLDHALHVYSDLDMGNTEKAYIPEKARVMFKRSLVLRSRRKYVEADAELEEAARLRRELVGPSTVQDIERLTAADFDDLVAFWSQ